jgi:hypothetical protein
MAGSSANGRVQTRDVEGVVEATNANGLKVGGAWLNVSRFGTPIDLPEAGAQVRVQVDDRGYIKALEVLGAPSPAAPAGEATIARLAVLKAAAHFAADRADIRSADVLRIADTWLKWVANT